MRFGFGNSSFKQRGFALVTLLLLSALFLTLAGAIGSEVLSGLHATRTRLGASTARFAAYAGLQHAVLLLRNDPTYSDDLIAYRMPDSENVSYTVVITNNHSGNSQIDAPDGAKVPPHSVYCSAMGVSNGSEGVALHAVTGLLTNNFPKVEYSAFSDRKVSLTDQSRSLSYNSATAVFSFDNNGLASTTDLEASGNVGSNLSVTLLSDATVSGNVYVPPSQSGVEALLAPHVDGDVEELPTPVEVPKYSAPVDYGQVANLTLPVTTLPQPSPGDTKVLPHLQVDSDVQVGPGRYFFPHGLDMHDAALLPTGDVSSTNPVVVFIGDHAALTGTSRVNPGGQSSDFQFYFVDQNSSESQEFTLKDQSQFFGTVVGNRVEGTFQDQSQLYGGFLGRTLSVKGSAAVYYDQSLHDLPLTVAANWGLSAITEPEPEGVVSTCSVIRTYVNAVKAGTVNYAPPVCQVNPSNNLQS